MVLTHAPGSSSPAPGKGGAGSRGVGGGGGRFSLGAPGAPAEGPLRPRPTPNAGRRGVRSLPSGERSHPASRPWAPIAGQQRRPVAECPHCTRCPASAGPRAPRCSRRGFSPEQIPGGGRGAGRRGEGGGGRGEGGSRRGEGGAVSISSLFPSWATAPSASCAAGSPAPPAGREPLPMPPLIQRHLRPQCPWSLWGHHGVPLPASPQPWGA